jgi:ribose/xylose/arabinose/galactoside ABC-type transport system permease subunit
MTNAVVQPPAQAASSNDGSIGLRRLRLMTVVRIGGAVAILAWALTSPGFLSPLAIFSLLTSISFVGCVAIGMTFITLSGNIMSLALGATVSVASVVFMASLGIGVAAAAIITLLFAGIITAAQGALVGFFRANPILVSIAALACILGCADVLTDGQRVYPGGEGFALFRTRPWGLPFGTLVFLAAAAIGQVILSATRLGREIVMVGSNRRASETAGLNTPAAVIWAYGIAGVASGLAGILLAARYGSGDMDIGTGYEYRAIAAVLVGGNAIQGGAGSVWRSCAGVIILATIEMALRLRGFSEQWQYFFTGLVMLAVVMLQGSMGRR